MFFGFYRKAVAVRRRVANERPVLEGFENSTVSSGVSSRLGQPSL
jgi:hypothetical protein